MPPDSRLFDAAEAIRSSMAAELASRGIVVPERSYVTAGQIAHDFTAEKCADAFVVSWTGTTPGTPEGNEEGGIGIVRCAVPLTHTFDIALIRCVPTLRTSAASGTALMPTDSELQDSAEEILSDSLTVADSFVEIALSGGLDDNRIELTGILSCVPIGPSGGAGGSVMRVLALVL